MRSPRISMQDIYSMFQQCYTQPALYFLIFIQTFKISLVLHFSPLLSGFLLANQLKIVAFHSLPLKIHTFFFQIIFKKIRFDTQNVFENYSFELTLSWTDGVILKILLAQTGFWVIWRAAREIFGDSLEILELRRKINGRNAE